MQNDTAHIRLVNDLRRNHFHDQLGIPCRSSCHGFLSGADKCIVRNGNAILLQQCHCLRFQQTIRGFEQLALRFCGSETGGIACALFPLAVGSHLFQHKGCILADLIARNAVCLQIGDALCHIGTHLHHCTHRLSNGFRRCHDLFCHRHGLKVRRAHVNHHGTVHLLQHGLRCPAVLFAGSLHGDIHRILHAGIGGQEFCQCCPDLRRGLRHLHIQLIRTVGGHDTGTAGVGDDGDFPSLHGRHQGEALADLKQFFQRIHTNGTALL